MRAKLFALYSLTLPGILLAELGSVSNYFLPDFLVGDVAQAQPEPPKKQQDDQTAQTEQAQPAQPAKPAKPAEADLNKVIIPDLKAVILYGDPADVSKGIISAHGLVVKDLTIPGGVEKLRTILEPMFLHKPLTQKLLQDIKKAIVQYYIDQKQPLVVVEVPEQNVSTGVLQLVVRKGRLGEVEVKGNKYFSNEVYLRYLDLEKGNAIDYDVLLTDIDWMNRSPFHHTDLMLTPGLFPGTTNVELISTDKRPVNVYVGADNTGIKQTGYERIYGGINITNIFGLQHILNYQYTISPRWPRYQAHVVNYTAPLPWKHIFIFTLGYERTKPIFMQFSGITRSIEGSLRYVIPIHPTYTPFTQELVFGADFADNYFNLSFFPGSSLPAEVFTDRAVMTQAMGGYNFSYQLARDKIIFSAELFYSPGSWLPDQTNAAYQRGRPFSKHNYVYGKLYVEDTHRFKNNFKVMGRIKGQLSDQNLLFNQYTLGDYYSVRGYKNQFGVDNALVLNFELQSPEIIFMKNKSGQCLFLAFFDYALGGDHKPLPVIEPRTVYLASVGPGFRFQIDPYLWVRLDYGFPLHKLPPLFEIVDQGRKPWLEFGLFLKY